MKTDDNYTQVLLQSYQNLNGFLCAFVDRSLPLHQYYVRNRFLLEKLLDHEFQIDESSEFIGRVNNVLFIGEETTANHAFPMIERFIIR